MNGFRRLQERLKEEGWYLGWNHYCCQTCAWMDVPDYFDAQYDKDGYLIREDKDGNEIEYKEVDLNKVLFNHSQDCQYELDEEFMDFFDDDDERSEEFFEEYEEARYAEEDGNEGAVLAICKKYGVESVLENQPEGLLREGSFVCYPPELQDESLFCFAGDKPGIKNLKEILPIIEECGCNWHWNQKGDSRISISW
jgi:hypothetical protein